MTAATTAAMTVRDMAPPWAIIRGSPKMSIAAGRFAGMLGRRKLLRGRTDRVHLVRREIGGWNTHTAFARPDRIAAPSALGWFDSSKRCLPSLPNVTSLLAVAQSRGTSPFGNAPHYIEMLGSTSFAGDLEP